MNKDFLFLILLLVIVFGVLFWQNPDTVVFYLDKIKAVMAPKLELSEDSGLDLSEVNISAFAPDKASANKEEEENGIGGPLIGELPGEDILEQETKQEVVVLEKKLTLEEIEQEVIRIAKEVERIDKEVQILVALDKTQ